MKAVWSQLQHHLMTASPSTQYPSQEKWRQYKIEREREQWCDIPIKRFHNLKWIRVCHFDLYLQGFNHRRSSFWSFSKTFHQWLMWQDAEMKFIEHRKTKMESKREIIRLSRMEREREEKTVFWFFFFFFNIRYLLDR